MKQLITIFFLIAANLVIGQKSDSSWFKNNVNIRGYVKDLRILNYSKPTNWIQDNFIHNRINIKIYPTQKLSVGVEMRNRLFYGESVKLNPLYTSTIDYDPGFFDVSWLWFDTKSAFLHSTIDRAWVGWTNEKWDIKLGRQRINWGISTVWNPNDLFNTYNFVDFDYEERPGSDAIRIQRYFKNYSSFEIAVKPETGKDNSVIAGLYKFNKWNYDFQVLGGIYQSDIAVGGGFAGNLKTAGLKGEGTYFHPKNNLSGKGVFNGSLGLDYSFQKGVFVGGGFLYNSSGINNSKDLTNPNLFSNTLSAKNLMPTKWSLFGQSSYPFSPILSGTMAIIYTPNVNLIFAMPSFSLSMANNWELLLLGQVYYGELTGNLGLLGSSIFVRTKYSF